MQIFGSKIQDVFQTFFQNNYFFFQVISRYLKNEEEKLFSGTLQTIGRDWIRFDQNEKQKFTSKALVVALKKKTLFFLPFVQTLSPFSSLFPGLENCWTNNNSRLSTSFDLLNVRPFGVAKAIRNMLLWAILISTQGFFLYFLISHSHCILNKLIHSLWFTI